MSKKKVAFAEGYAQAVHDSGWQCGDCGNSYDSSVDFCPNRLLDQALVDLKFSQRT